LLAMDVNDNACCLNARVVLAFFASKTDRRTVAPTGKRVQLRSGRPVYRLALLLRYAPLREAARSYREHDMNVLMGAPNIVRGGSHSGNVTAADLAAAGLPVVQQVWRQAMRVF